MTSNSSLRKRNPKAPSSNATTDNAANRKLKPQPGITPSISDTIRILTTLLALILSLSYYLTSGDSLTFHHRPWFTRLDRLKAYTRGPLLLTRKELSLHNGTSPNLPIILSLNHTLFDVSAAPHTYGPGGSYHIFAGRDATRAFVTGCFDENDGGLSADLRGVERMYIPIEDLDGEEGQSESLTSGQKKIRAEQEKREARKRVHKEVEKWVRFYQGHAKYFEVGRLVVEKDSGVGDRHYGGEGQVPGLCEAAERARPRRSQMIATANGDSDSAAGEGRNARRKGAVTPEKEGDEGG